MSIYQESISKYECVCVREKEKETEAEEQKRVVMVTKMKDDMMMVTCVKKLCGQWAMTFMMAYTIVMFESIEG